MSISLSSFTTFRLGGPCAALYDCTDPAALVATVRELAARGERTVLIGGGSNLLVADAGLETSVIRYAAAVPDVRVDGEAVLVSAATALDDLAAWSVLEGWGGLVTCSGIPGTVGGAVVGNAGAFGEQIGDRVEAVEIIDRAGTLHWLAAEALGFAYRTSILAHRQDIVVRVRLRLPPGEAVALREERERILSLRASKHPDWHTVRTAGSFFKNIEPTSKAGRRQAAGWFLEQAGAKDLRVGGARLFEKHANIIIAEDGCTAADVDRLADLMAARVQASFGLALQREVRRLGPFPSVPAG